MACIAVAFCMATVIGSPAQATFSSLLSFDETNGDVPLGGLVQGTDGDFYGTTTYGGAQFIGTVFKIGPSGKLTTLYSFCSQANCADGSYPEAGLLQASDGNFYGTTSVGGAYGTVFRITSAGSLTTLHSFDVTDGDSPEAGLLQATNGNFYGTTGYGGSGNGGTVFKITPAGKFTSLYSFCTQATCPDGAYPSGLIQGSDGNFYGTTANGGASGAGTVFKITSAGRLTTLHSFDTTDGATPRGGLVQATNGILYGTTGYGGSGDGGTAFEITPAGEFTSLYSFCTQPGCPDGTLPYSTLIQATDGNFYGTTYASAGESGSGTVFEITPAGQLTTLHGFDYTDGSNPSGALLQATNGTFYGTTTNGGANRDGTIFSLATGLEPFVKTLPMSGRVGAKVIVLGTSLTGATIVSFGGTAATFKVASSSEITATVPAGATTGAVTVTTPGTTLSSNAAFLVIPQIKSFAPPSGPVGTQVTITGVSLTQTTSVTFAGATATTVAVDSDTQVTATVPANAKTGKIQITTPGGTVTTTTSFTVTTP